MIVLRECRKSVQKEYKTRDDWVGKVIRWELSKKFKFDHKNNGQFGIRLREGFAQTH